MPGTVAISDLHLGGYAGRCVLDAPAVRAALARRLAGTERLVLLGDLLELGEGRPAAEVLELARPVLETLAGAAQEIVLIPGNHDRLLIRDWLTAQGPGLALENEVAPDVSPLLTETVDHLGARGARVAVHYPGFALSETVWTTHGHYLDRLLVPEMPYGFQRRPALHSPAAYERRRVGAPRPRPLSRAQEMVRPALARAASATLDRQMRRHATPALAAVLGALGVRAEHVIFGHVHRLGPLAEDRPRDWEFPLTSGGAPTRFHNTGSWQNERRLVGHARGNRHYWPGGGVAIGADGVPHAVRLLEGPDLGPGFGVR